MTRVHLSIASNIQPQRHIPSGLARLDAVSPIEAVSPFWVTPAIGRTEQPDYWNGVVAVQTDLVLAEFDQTLRAIEAAAGRVRGADKWAARELDLDILLWDGAVRDGGVAAELEGRPWLRAGLAALEVPGWQAPTDDPGYPVAPWMWSPPL